MKRAFPNKVKPVDTCEINNDATVEPSKPGMGGKGRTRKSVAVIGLAISMGTSGMLLHKGSDSAVAAEPAADAATELLPVSQNGVASDATVNAYGQQSYQEAAGLTTPRQTASRIGRSQGPALLRLTQHYSAASSGTVIGIASESGIQSKKDSSIPSVNGLVPTKKGDKTIATMPHQRSYTPSPSDQQSAPLRKFASPLLVTPSNIARTTPAEESITGSRPVNPLMLPQNEVMRGANSSEDPTAVGQTEWESEKSVELSPAAAAESINRFVVEGLQGDPSTHQDVNLAQPTPGMDAATGILDAASAESTRGEVTPKIPGVVVIEPDGVVAPVSVLYQIRSGDTLDQIADAHGISVKELIAANDINDPDFLKVNEQIKIPQTPSTGLVEEATSTLMPSVSGEAYRPMVLPSEGIAAAPVVPIISELKLSEHQGNIAVPTVPKLAMTAVNRGASTPNLPVVLTSSQSTFKGVDNGKTIDHRDELKVSASKSWDELSYRHSSSATSPSEAASNPYAERLRAEIVRLREQYKADRGATSNDPLVTATALETSSDATAGVSQSAEHLRINPEFAPNGVVQDEMSSPQSQEWQRHYQTRLQDSSDGGAAAISTDAARPNTAQQQQVATAPFANSAFDPLKNPSLGRMVSPQLPPLPEASTYLPGGGSTQFTGFAWPAKGEITSGYGWRWGRMHKGIDIAAPVGTPIYAAAPGVVTYAEWNDGGYGYLVEIEHPNGSFTRYGHNSRLLVKEGQKVAQGEQISEMGSTGFSTGPHLHFEIHPTGEGAVNPMAYLPGDSPNDATASR